MKQKICVDCPLPVLGRSPVAIRCKVCARLRMQKYNKKFQKNYRRKQK